MKRIKLLVLVVAVLLIAAQNISMFIVPSTLDLTLGSAFWTSFVFVNLAYVVTTLIILLGLNEKKDSVIHVGALLGVVYAYLVVETALANIFVYLPNAKFLPVFLSQLASFLVFMALIVMVLLGIFWKEKNNKVIRQKVNYINALELDLTKALGVVEDIEIRKQLEAFKEKVHFSDPMSNVNCELEEKKIAELCKEIVSKAYDKKFEEILGLVKEAERFLVSRNQICLTTK